MSDERNLTKEDREKIQRLLESGTLENVTLALSLIEETAGQEDIAEIFTMNVIVELICLGDPLLQAASIMRKCPNTSKVFVEALATRACDLANKLISKHWRCWFSIDENDISNCKWWIAPIGTSGMFPMVRGGVGSLHIALRQACYDSGALVRPI